MAAESTQISAWIGIDHAVCRLNARHTLEVDRLILGPGQHWCVFGGNGSGKSLLAKLISGKLLCGKAALTYQHGFDPGTDILEVSFAEQQRLWELDNRHDISEYSDNACDPGTCVMELITTRAADEPIRDQPLLDTLCRELNLRHLLKQGLRYLSSGQLRKAMLARALYLQPRLLILDEPLESIDRESSAGIARLLEQRMQGQNCTMVLTRRRQDILPGFTHMALMADLKMLAQGPFQEILATGIFQGLTVAAPVLPGRLPAPLTRQQRDCFASMQDINAEPLIELRNVSAAYQGMPVLADINWIFRRRQHALIEGPNGCGKSTLLGMISGDNHKAYGQQVRLFGCQRGSGESVWDIRSRLGLVSNELHNRYVKGWRVLEVVVSGLYDSVGLYDDCSASEQRCAREWLAALGMAAMESAAYHELSFGQQRLVLVARAMVKQPEILILDEPCVGLDDHYRTLILFLLDQIASQTDTQLIYVSHTQGEHPRCINQFLQFVPQADISSAHRQEDVADPGSIRSRTRYRLEIH